MPPISTSSDVTDFITTVTSLEEKSTFSSEFVTSSLWGTTSQTFLISVTSGEFVEEVSEGKPTESDKEKGVSAATVLLFSISFIIGCFALTALVLRIGSRLKKAKMEAKEKKRNRRLTMNNKMKIEENKQTHKKLTIRMHTGKDSVKDASKTRKSSARDSEDSGSTGATIALNDRQSASFFKNERKKKKAGVKTNKTLQALIDIGAFPQDIALYSFPTSGDSQKDGQNVPPYVTKQVELTNLSSEDAAYTNEAFDVSNPDNLQSGYSLRDRDRVGPPESLDGTQQSFSKTETDYNEHGLFNLSVLSKEEMSPGLMLVDHEKDLSEGSSTKENVAMLDPSRYSAESSSDSEGSPVTKAKYFPMKYLKHYDKNRNNSRDSGYVESLTSQDSVKKRKLGIVEPFYHRAFLEDQVGSRGMSELDDILVSQCPTCRTLTPQKQIPSHRKGSVASHESDNPLMKISPFRKSSIVHSPYLHGHRILGKRSSYASVYPSYSLKKQPHNRSHSVVGEKADYNMKYSQYPSYKYIKRQDSATQTDGAPLHRKSTVRWKKEGGNFILTPIENNEIDHLGPIYLSSET